nr:PAS domain S-box protein [Oculatella sp. LEGE 06141]
MYQQISEAIAKRKQAEIALRLSEQNFSAAFQCSPNPVTLGTFPEGRFIVVNESFQRVFGYTPEEAIGHTPVELQLWSNLDAGNSMIALLRDKKAFRNHEHRFRTKSGEQKTVLFSAELIKIGQQELLLTVANDITQRKQAEEGLQDSERRFRTLVEQAADAFFVVNAEGKILDANQQACNYLKYTREELMQLTVQDIETQVTLEEFRTGWQRLAPGVSITITGEYRRKDGTRFPVEVRASLIEAGGQLLLLALARDISERKQTEKAMAQLAEIGELAAMIVHEVRNPLTTILLGLQSFQQLELPERAQTRLAFALEESDRLQRLLNEILLYARQQSLQMSALELNALIVELLDSLRSMPVAAGRQIHFVAAPMPINISGDKDKLRQVFINLISNACEAVSLGDVVTWTIKLAPSQQQVCIQVHNSGEPIPPELLPKLTQPFQTTKPSGNGLGLAIAKRIVEAHHGELTIESAMATGTTVSIHFPIALPQ